jgi:hypothetical protein
VRRVCLLRRALRSILLILRGGMLAAGDSRLMDHSESKLLSCVIVIQLGERGCHLHVTPAVKRHLEKVDT